MCLVGVRERSLTIRIPPSGLPSQTPTTKHPAVNDTNQYVLVDEYVWDRQGGMTRGIVIRGQVFCVPQIAPDFHDARLIQASAGIQQDLSSQVGGALSLTPGNDQNGRWGDIFVPRESRVRGRVRIWGY